MQPLFQSILVLCICQRECRHFHTQKMSNLCEICKWWYLFNVGCLKTYLCTLQQSERWQFKFAFFYLERIIAVVSRFIWLRYGEGSINCEVEATECTKDFELLQQKISSIGWSLYLQMVTFFFVEIPIHPPSVGPSHEKKILPKFHTLR